MKGVAASPLPFLPLLFPLLPICHFFIGDADNTLTFLSNLLLRFLSSFPSFLLHLQRMAGPPLLPFRDTSERMEKRTGQHQLLLASCGTCMRMWMPVATDVDPPSLATTTASASAQYHTVLQKKTPTLSLWAALPPYGYIFSLFHFLPFYKKKKSCYVLLSSQMRCTRVDHALTFELGIVFGRTGGRGTSTSKPRVLSSAREGSRWKQPTKREGSARCARAHTWHDK